MVLGREIKLRPVPGEARLLTLERIMKSIVAEAGAN
jgi:hypothetical protein